MKYLVTGSSGMVGQAISGIFGKSNCVLTDTEKLDVRYWEDVFKNFSMSLKAIIHLGAETDLEFCQKNPELAYFCNHTGCINMTLLAEKMNIPIVYISTAGVFDGKKEGPYSEYDMPNPINHYGRSKLYGEYAVKSYAKHYIFRAGWMMGGGIERDKKFVMKIFKELKVKPEICAVDNVYGSPTLTWDLARTIKNVLDNEAEYGVYHCCGEGIASRYDVARMIVEGMGLDIDVVPVKSSYFKQRFPCTRSHNETMENSKLNTLGLSKMRNWKDSLSEYVREEFYGLI